MNKMTGQNGSPEQNTPITTEFILPPDTPLSSLIQDNTHVHYQNLLNRLMWKQPTNS